MTAITGIGRIPSGVTGGAGNLPALTMIQREGMVSIECSGSPRGCGVTGNAVRAKLTRMFSRFGMTSQTGCIQSFELTVCMALLTVHGCVRPCQREVGKGMIKRCAIPSLWGMTGGAVCAELAVMFIIFLMAGDTILGRAFEHVVDMALVTLHFCVFAFQFES